MATEERVMNAIQKYPITSRESVYFSDPDDPDGDLLGFQISHAKKIVKLSESAKKALDFAISMS